MGILSPIPDSLVRELAAVFPDRCPDLELSDREVWFRAGQAAVVRFLADEADLQSQQGRV